MAAGGCREGEGSDWAAAAAVLSREAVGGCCGGCVLGCSCAGAAAAEAVGGVETLKVLRSEKEQGSDLIEKRQA